MFLSVNRRISLTPAAGHTAAAAAAAAAAGHAAGPRVTNLALTR